MSLSKITGVIAGLTLLALTAVSFTPVFADSPGQLGGGSEVYEVKNLTKGGSYANTISAAACDEVQYSIMLHNTSYGGFTDVKVNVSLPASSSASNSSTVTATTNLGGTTGTTGTATVNISSAQTISYENGSTVLYDVNGNVIKSLPDTITSSGVDIGALNGSTTEFVNFKAKVSCPSTPAPTSFTATATATATASASAKATCPNPSQGSATATASASATATASATSNVSQADANQQAQTAAQQQASDKAQADAKAQAQAKAEASVKCSAPIVETTSVKKAPAQKATVLPNTGAGDVIGLFAGSSALGTVGHFFVSRRRR